MRCAGVPISVNLAAVDDYIACGNGTESAGFAKIIALTFWLKAVTVSPKPESLRTISARGGSGVVGNGVGFGTIV